MSDSQNDASWPVPEHSGQVPSELPPSRTSSKAVLALLLGLAGLFLWILTAIPAIVLACRAKRDIRANARLRGRPLANLALLLGIAGIVVAPFETMPIILGWLIASQTSQGLEPEAPRIVQFNLTGTFSDAPHSTLLSGQSDSLLRLLSRIKEATKDDAVKAVFVTLDGLEVDFSQMEELHAAFETLEASGKKVFVHSEEAFMPMPAYAMLSGASRINIVPTGLINLAGIRGSGLYVKDGLAKLGIEADVVHIGEYKSAGEMVTRTGPSEPAQQEMNWLFDGLYETCVNRIAQSRNMTADEVRRLVDDGPYTAERAHKAGLVDSVMYRDEFVEEIRKTYGTNIDIDSYYLEPRGPDIDGISLLDLLLVVLSEFTGPSPEPPQDCIGIVFVEGTIVPGYADSDSTGMAYSGDVRKALEKAASSRLIKAVVLRVNSPGGSVTASEVILRAALECKKKKPLVVSMGRLAASGGYYVSCGADAIFADETTLTASIGVVGGKLVTAGMWSKLGVNWSSYKRGANADWVSGAQPFTEQQRTRLHEDMNAMYATFKDHVVAGRGDNLTKPIEELAAGRVFTGKQALGLGLVDQIGGLNEAIQYAADKVSLKDYGVRVVPRPKGIASMILEAVLGSSERPSDLEPQAGLGQPRAVGYQGLAARFAASDAMVPLLGKLDAPHARAAIQMLEFADLLNQESILIMMVQVPVIN